jgi:hypothetical protein
MFVFYVQVLHKRGLGRNRFLAKATITLFVLCTTHCVLVLAAVAKRSTLDLAVLLLVGGDPVPKGKPLMPILRGLSLAANVVYVTAKYVLSFFVVYDLLTHLALPKRASRHNFRSFTRMPVVLL